MALKSCRKCGKELSGYPSKVARAKYCSRSCATLGNKHRVGKVPWNKGLKHLDIMGNKHWNWQGGRRRANNYVQVYVEGIGHVYEHRRVMEQKLGRLLERHEEVHHINGKHKDNRPENLMIMLAGEHQKFHWDGIKFGKGAIRYGTQIV